MPEQDQNEKKDTKAKHDKKPKVPSKVKIARLYPFLFLLRRLYMVLIIVFVPNTRFEVKIYSLIGMQILRTFYAYMITNFHSMKDRIIDALNEMVYLVLIFLLSLHKNFYDWTEKATFIFIGIIL